MFTNGNVCIILTRKLKLRRSTFPPISTKRTITHQIVEYRKYREMWYTGERFIRSQTPPLWIIRSHDFWQKYLVWHDIIRTTKVYTINVRWSRRYKYFKIIITIWLTVMKYPYLKWQRILSVLRIFCSFLSHGQYCKSEELFTLCEHFVSTQLQFLMWGLSCLYF